MTTFKFNFNGTDEEAPLIENEGIQWMHCEKIEPKDQIRNLDVIAKQAKMFICGDVEIGLVINNQLLIKFNNGIENAIILAEENHSDLVTGKYEGGLKVWECTYDLIQYLEENNIVFQNKQVIDLGCGTGILGIYAFLKKAMVTFQDYNKDILEYVTIPNVLLNIEDEDSRPYEVEKCKFYSGDWNSFNNFLSDNDKYDVILTSETIYNLKNYDKLINIFEQRLNTNGAVYVAAKTYYFGVGGGMREFENAIKNSGKLQSEIIWKTANGIQREIMKINKL